MTILDRLFTPHPGATHECAHAAVALILGFEVTEIRIDRPEPETIGWCRTPFEGRKLNTGDLIVTLAGGIVDGRDGATDFSEWPPSWPLVDGRGDQGRAYRIVRALEIDPETYAELVAFTAEIIDSQSFKSLHRALEDALMEHDYLDSAQIKAIAEPHLDRMKEN